MKKSILKNGKVSISHGLEKLSKQVRFFILMALPLAVHKITGSINWPDKVDDIKTRARFIYTKSLASGIAFGGTVLADYLALIVAYEGASAADRPGAFYSMNNAAQSILATVQGLASASPLRAIGILYSCGFNVIPAHGAHVAEFDVTNGTTPGSADLITAGGPTKNHLHIWYSSVDEGTTWLMVAASNKRKVTLTGYAHAKDVLFKTQLSIEDVLQPMSNIIPLLIN